MTADRAPAMYDPGAETMPAEQRAGLQQRALSGMITRLYHHIADSRRWIKNHMPRSTKRDDFGIIPNTALRATAKPCRASLAINFSGS